MRFEQPTVATALGMDEAWIKSVLIIFRKESLLFDVLCLFRKGRAPVEDFQILFCPDLSTSSGCSNSATYSQRDGCLLENTI